MISTHGLSFRQQKTIQMLQTCTHEYPFSVQLFGADPKYMEKSVIILNEFKPDILDINMGCPVKKVTKKGAGAALMSTPSLAEELIKIAVDNSRAPVTVKFRAGVDLDSLSAVSFGELAQNAGASAVTVHGRTWSQGFSGSANWDLIKEVKQALDIPVIGNGDVLSKAQGLARLKQSGCDGIMIGRGALGNPWIFSEQEKPDNNFDICRIVLQHLCYIEEYLPAERMLGCIKNNIGKYFTNIQGSSAMRRMVYDSKSFSELKHNIIHLMDTSELQ